MTFNDPLRYTFGQEGNYLNFRKMMGEGVSVIFNLAGLDEETQCLIVSMLAMGFDYAAFSRADMLDSERMLYRLIIDEVQNCSAKSETGFNPTLFGDRQVQSAPYVLKPVPQPSIT